MDHVDIDSNIVAPTRTPHNGKARSSLFGSVGIPHTDWRANSTTTLISLDCRQGSGFGFEVLQVPLPSVTAGERLLDTAERREVCRKDCLPYLNTLSLGMFAIWLEDPGALRSEEATEWSPAPSSDRESRQSSDSLMEGAPPDYSSFLHL
ncbi:hypothetical protein CMUS01_12536 [Colletotrichum musicola]|uniref:Uncharacterized protein n=1 Tax=Colletotrichum musicola TaxID=2175873 RepID=A0A8H6JLB5_9PEZI|nr:hypothetical protein CMUS01_12536 [Colletotrichum musicola]